MWLILIIDNNYLLDTYGITVVRGFRSVYSALGLPPSRILTYFLCNTLLWRWKWMYVGGSGAKDLKV